MCGVGRECKELVGWMVKYSIWIISEGMEINKNCDDDEFYLRFYYILLNISFFLIGEIIIWSVDRVNFNWVL